MRREACSLPGQGPRLAAEVRSDTIPAPEAEGCTLEMFHLRSRPDTVSHLLVQRLLTVQRVAAVTCAYLRTRRRARAFCACARAGKPARYARPPVCTTRVTRARARVGGGKNPAQSPARPSVPLVLVPEPEPVDRETLGALRLQSHHAQIRL